MFLPGGSKQHTVGKVGVFTWTRWFTFTLGDSEVLGDPQGEVVERCWASQNGVGRAVNGR